MPHVDSREKMGVGAVSSRISPVRDCQMLLVDPRTQIGLAEPLPLRDGMEKLALWKRFSRV